MYLTYYCITNLILTSCFQHCGHNFDQNFYCLEPSSKFIFALWLETSEFTMTLKCRNIISNHFSTMVTCCSNSSYRICYSKSTPTLYHVCPDVPSSHYNTNICTLIVVLNMNMLLLINEI